MFRNDQLASLAPASPASTASSITTIQSANPVLITTTVTFSATQTASPQACNATKTQSLEPTRLGIELSVGVPLTLALIATMLMLGVERKRSKTLAAADKEHATLELERPFWTLLSRKLHRLWMGNQRFPQIYEVSENFRPHELMS